MLCNLLIKYYYFYARDRNEEAHEKNQMKCHIELKILSLNTVQSLIHDKLIISKLTSERCKFNYLS